MLHQWVLSVVVGPAASAAPGLRACWKCKFSAQPSIRNLLNQKLGVGCSHLQVTKPLGGFDAAQGCKPLSRRQEVFSGNK